MPLYGAEKPEKEVKVLKIFNIDDYDYFIFRGRRVTFSGIIDILVAEREAKFLNEVKKRIRNEGYN